MMITSNTALIRSGISVTGCELGIPANPVSDGGHAVFVDCTKMVPHIPYDQFPAQAVRMNSIFEGGIRAVEIGSFMLT